MTLTGIYRGQRVIVGGFAPDVFLLNERFLETGVVIGVNQFCREFYRYVDYGIMLDTFRYGEPGWSWLDAFRKSKPLFLRRPNGLAVGERPDEMPVEPPLGVHYFDISKEPELELEWRGRLQYASSTAMAAVHLALIMGASEIVLYGVSFKGNGRADGSQYPPAQSGHSAFWDVHLPGINAFLRRCSRYVMIYKSDPESLLEVPLWPGNLAKAPSP